MRGHRRGMFPGTTAIDDGSRSSQKSLCYYLFTQSMTNRNNEFSLHKKIPPIMGGNIHLALARAGGLRGGTPIGAVLTAGHYSSTDSCTGAESALGLVSSAAWPTA